MSKLLKVLLITSVFGFIAGCKNMDTSSMDLLNLQPNDHTITTSVYEAMKKDPMLAHAKIQVHTEHHVVNLSGRVKTIRQSDTAEAIAKHTAGVKEVKNHIVVRK